MNLLFLDIDGVLNSAHSITMLGNSRPSRDPEDVNLDPVAVTLLKKLCEKCDLYIFIHSNWWGRRVDEKYLSAEFSSYDLKRARIIGRCSIGDRVDRINMGLMGYKPKDFLVLNDRDLQNHYDSYAIVVNRTVGFGLRHYEQALKHLGRIKEVFHLNMSAGDRETWSVPS